MLKHSCDNTKKYTEADYIFWEEFYIPETGDTKGDIDDLIYPSNEYRGPSQR